MWGRQHNKADAYFNEGANHLVKDKMGEALRAFYLAYQQHHPEALGNLKSILKTSANENIPQRFDKITKPELLKIIEAAFKDDPAKLLEIFKSCAKEGNDLGNRFHRQEGLKKCAPNKGSLKIINERIAQLENQLGAEMVTLQKPKSGI